MVPTIFTLSIVISRSIYLNLRERDEIKNSIRSKLYYEKLKQTWILNGKKQIKPERENILKTGKTNFKIYLFSKFNN